MWPELWRPLTRLSTGGAFRRRLGLGSLFLLVIVLFLRLWALSTHRRALLSLGYSKFTSSSPRTTNRSRAGSLPVVLLGLLGVFLCLRMVMLAFMLNKKEKYSDKIIFLIATSQRSSHHTRLTSKTCMKSLNILFLSASRVMSSKADSFKNLSRTCHDVTTMTSALTSPSELEITNITELQMRIEGTHRLPCGLWLQWWCGLLQHVFKCCFFPLHLPGLFFLSLSLPRLCLLQQLHMGKLRHGFEARRPKTLNPYPEILNMVWKYHLENLTLLKASLMFPASSVVARLSELMTDPKSSKFVLISTGKLLSCITADGERVSQKTEKSHISWLKEQAKVHTHPSELPCVTVVHTHRPNDSVSHVYSVCVVFVLIWRSVRQVLLWEYP